MDIVQQIIDEIKRRIDLYKDAEYVSAHICGYLDANETLLEYIESLKKKTEEPHIQSHTKLTIGTKIRSKANPDVILSIISDDCHEDEFECSNGSVLSLKQIEKYYDIYIEEK